MKKLTLIFSILSLLACKCTPTKTSTNTEALASSRKVTLNNVDSATAAKMVQAFRAKPTSIDSLTSIWFSQAFIDNVLSLLTYEDGDGIRIYFAKDSADHNTVVMVSTKKGPSSTSSSGYDHIDYFDHSTPILSSTMEIKKIEYGPIKGFDLPCPSIETCDTNQKNHISCIDAHKFIADFKGGAINVNSLWYSIDLMKKIHFELIAAQAQHVAAEGVRLYFAKNKMKNNTFVFVTTKNVDGYQQDYYDCYGNIPLRYFTKINAKIHGGDDHGEECPVFCKGVSF